VGNRKRNVLEIVDPRTLDPDKVFHWRFYYTIAVKRHDRGENAIMKNDEGDSSGVAEGNVFTRVQETLKLPKTPR
jgi:hypothetical protein